MLETDRWVQLYWSTQWLFLQDLHSWRIPTFQKNVKLLSSRHQYWQWRHCSSRMLVPTYQYTTQCHNPAYSNMGIHHCENYKFHTLILSVTNFHKSFLRNTTLHKDIITSWFWHQQMFQAVAQKAPSAKICALDVLGVRGWTEVVSCKWYISQLQCGIKSCRWQL